MKYQLVPHGPRMEAIGAHSGYRIRMSTLSTKGLDTYPVTVHVRGSESEDEVLVNVPKKHHVDATDALDFGYDCACLWIDALDHRIT